MNQDRQDASASYTIRARAAPEETTQDFSVLRLSTGLRVFMIVTGAAILAIAVALAVMAGGLMHADSVNSGQAAQIRGLNQANARMSLQISQMAATLSGQNPASDTDLVTCGDLRHMGLTVTTGGSVSSVPGSVDLSSNPVRLPAHCSKE
jgi:hypothetical protein